MSITVLSTEYKCHLLPAIVVLGGNSGHSQAKLSYDNGHTVLQHGTERFGQEQRASRTQDAKTPCSILNLDRGR